MKMLMSFILFIQKTSIIIYVIHIYLVMDYDISLFLPEYLKIISKSGWFTYNILTVPYASSMLIITNDLYFNLSHIFDYLLQEKMT